jgi:hypothetical protein
MIRVNDSPGARSGGDLLVGRYTSSGDLALEGPPDALRSLARRLRQAPSSIPLGRPASGNPSPYDGFLETIEVQRAETKVTIRKREGALLVCGNGACLEVLAANVEALSEDETVGEHLHLDYHPGHFFLDPTSSPLVVELTRWPE